MHELDPIFIIQIANRQTQLCEKTFLLFFLLNIIYTLYIGIVTNNYETIAITYLFVFSIDFIFDRRQRLLR